MTTGQIIFYSGIGMLILTVIIGVAFWIKKPQYTPESAVYHGIDGKGTQKLRNGYPTDRLTVCKEPKCPPVVETISLHDETERLEVERAKPLPCTEILSDTEASGIQRTEKLKVGTEPLFVETDSLVNDAVSSVSVELPPFLSPKETISLVEDGEQMAQKSTDATGGGG